MVRVGSTDVQPRGTAGAVTVHGDDFAAAGETQSLDMLNEALEHFFVLKKMPGIGLLEVGGTSEGQCTKRTLSWSVDGFDWRADSLHGEKFVWCCFPDKREATRMLTSLGSKHIGKSARDAAEKLKEEKRDGYRSMAPTAQYVVVDCPDLQYTTSVLTRTLVTPLMLQEMELVRLASCVSAVQELRWDFQVQEMPDESPR